VLDDLFFEAIKGVERLKPKVVIFENVMGLLFKKNKTYEIKCRGLRRQKYLN
jgi:site-specific DNA-cytosine methylase